MKGKPKIDYTGQTFNRWTVLKWISKGVFECKCDCGTIRNVRARALKTNRSKSCGCYKSELQAKLVAQRSYKHGHDYTCPTYRCWVSMRRRCTEKSHKFYKNYGGRGIKICKRWDNFFNFLSDMGKRPSLSHSIDRINNNGNYTPKNCRWANQKEQCRNTRRNRMLEFNDEKKPLVTWAEEFFINKGTLISRINRGWSTKEALTIPVGGTRL